MSFGDPFKTSGAVKNSETEMREHQPEVYAKRVMTVPRPMQIRIAYNGDNLEEYVGYAPRGLATNVQGWMILKLTYTNTTYLSLIQTAYDTWDNRASATYA